MRALFLTSLLSLAGVLVLQADPAPDTSPITLAVFRSDHPPFSFVYGGKNSGDFLSTWKKDEQTQPSDGGETHHFTFTDPATQLEVAIDVRTFTDFPAVEWLMHFTNKGAQDTPILEQILPLDWPDALKGLGGECLLHLTQGSRGGPTDYQPYERMINGGDGVQGELCSSNDLPFFNLQHGDQGVIEAIGWSGTWRASFLPDHDNTAVRFQAGAQQTHLLLHPGETIRMPRILLMPWHGEYADSQNLWRRLALAYYSPRDLQNKRIDVPFTVGSWGEEPIDKQIALINAVHDRKIGMEVYWMDAGWYGDPAKNWGENRGNWTPNKKDFPNGLKPLGDLLHQLDYGFLLWMAPEQAVSGTAILTQHPDWFIPDNPTRERIKMGDPAVCKGITDYVTAILKDAGANWFRQDGDSAPEGPGDAPDRIGMGEINYVTNFLTFWDSLRTNIPGLQIDNCDSGGKRLDLDTMSRSISLWRSDSMVAAYDPSMEQCQAQGMIQWIPLSAGSYPVDASATPGSAKQLYEARSTYCAGWGFGISLPLADWMKAQSDEYSQVRPYFYGDFYPLVAYTMSLDAWAAWQLDRPDLKSGVVILLRRQQSPFSTITLPLHKIDPAATYEVEVRSGIAKAAVQKMSGADLVKLPISIADEPGSALVFYKKM
jgi:alpha-galactosidase